MPQSLSTYWVWRLLRRIATIWKILAECSFPLLLWIGRLLYWLCSSTGTYQEPANQGCISINTEKRLTHAHLLPRGRILEKPYENSAGIHYKDGRDYHVGRETGQADNQEDGHEAGKADAAKHCQSPQNDYIEKDGHAVSDKRRAEGKDGQVDYDYLEDGPRAPDYHEEVMENCDEN